MSEASRPSRITITLGRSGQVIKRAGAELDDDGKSYEHPRAGTKRPVRERLGSRLDSSSLHGSDVSNKRQRGDASFGADGLQIGKDDLRLKLMRKNAQRRAQRDDCSSMDLRAKISRTEQPSRNFDTRPRMDEPRDVSGHSLLPPSRPANSFSQMGSTSNSFSPWTLNHMQGRSPQRFVGTSRDMSPPRNGGSFIGSSRRLSPPRNGGGFMGGSRALSPTRNAASYMNAPRVLSPPRNAGNYMGSSRVSSPPRNIKDFGGRPLSGVFDDVRASPYTVKGVLNAQPPVISAPYPARMHLPPSAAKPPLPAFSAQIPPPGSALQKTPFTVEEHQTVDSLLNSLGLGKYAVLFKAEEVDMAALRQMGESDLKDLTIPMGPRKKILEALASRPKRP
ncbi:PREDICTED: uncharacterized protein LOC104822953 [Tarenaya hassleriana]|uniref:uncharacterized protein LOC104822953 n=1 Tax=Tarenaya hassleriana TaxID=28532 RepID=UPI00053C4299|nr:PREDICTED: uncharacterized protein LOC104822953 [Tarenaya hassleriana]XP_010552629.1 PREDICTED: uncharacterized protein LOC104822953 [Tarenaya hassleriana]